jgi:esterase/lipase superfamily enzyme
MLFATALLAGCATQRPLMPTPNLYAAQVEAPYAAALPEALRTVRVQIPYATDRAPEPRADGRMDYGIGRSASLAVGTAVVQIGDGVPWQTLLEDAHTGERERTLGLEVVSVSELARSPQFPLAYRMVDGLPQLKPQAQVGLKKIVDQIEVAVRRRLAESPRQEVLLYVHGVANTFDEALSTTAELWHYTGRELVPVAFTWPAGKGGLLRGYTYDRESSEFAVFHFKRFLDLLGRMPEVEGIHVIAHSRGTDVVTTGIRELLIESHARREPARARLKLRNVVLAAPDINLDVTMMRTASEFFGSGMERLTLYTSPNDKAIGIAEFLFGGGLRLGALDFTTEGGVLKDLADREMVGNIAVVEYVGKQGGAFGHDYFRTNPAVSSDLVLTVRYDRNPGAEHGRPLRHQRGIFWAIDDDYPATRPPP